MGCYWGAVEKAMKNKIMPDDNLIEKFIRQLKELKIQHYVCNRCGYSQGHQNIYCPKCSGKMIYRKERQYDDFCRSTAGKNCGYYKHLYINTYGEWISHKDWIGIVERYRIKP